MRFEDFIANQKARKSRPDLQLARSLAKMSDNHINAIKSLEINQTTSSTVMMAYYEALREIVEAIAVKEGYKVYSHEAFTYFLKERGEDRTSRYFDQFRKIRNGINYYGRTVNPETTKENVREIESLISKLKKKHLSDIV